MNEKIFELPRTEEDFKGLKTFIKQQGGPDKVMFFAQMNPYTLITPFGFGFVDGNKYNWVLCKVSEDRYLVEEGYKITLVPIDKHYASRDFYQCDFCSGIETGWIIPYIPDASGKTPYIRHFIGREELMPGVYIHHEWDYIDYK